MVGDDFRKTLNEIAALWFFFGVVFLGFSLLAFFLGRGAESAEFSKVLFLYFGIGLSGGIILTVAKVYEYYNPGSWFQSSFHDPDEGVQVITRYRLFRNPVLLFFFFFSFFFLIGLLVFATKQTAFADIPQFQFQQISRSAEIILNVEPAATSETFMIGVFVSFLLGGVRRIVIGRFGMPRWVSLFVSFFLVVPVIGLLWLGYHNFVYGNDEVASLYTLIFGLGGGLLSVVFGSLLPWLAWHEVNNLIVASMKFLSGNESIILFGSLAFVSVVFIGLSVFIFKGEELF